MAPTAGHPQVATFIGRCRACKVSRRFDAFTVASTTRSLGRDRFGYERKAWTRTFTIAGAEPFVVGAGSSATERSDRPGSLWLTCPAGHSVEFRRLKGHVTDQACGAKCMGATGPSCDCSCGGHKHGASHAA
jgi:hypothetical protein